MHLPTHLPDLTPPPYLVQYYPVPAYTHTIQQKRLVWQNRH